MFTEEVLLQQAGKAQIAAGTSKPEWQIYGTERVPAYTKTDRLIWVDKKVMLPPYGDDPHDQEMIKQGFKYYDVKKKYLHEED